jgi:hypothetical protein
MLSSNNQNVWKGKNINVGEATGTTSSIREWLKVGFGHNKKQQRALEAIISSFAVPYITLYSYRYNIRVGIP